MSINYLEVWSDNELIRPIDYQLARQAVQWEAGHGVTSAQEQQALMLTACAVSYVLGRGQVCLELSAWPKALALPAEQIPTTEQLKRCKTVAVASSETDDVSALLVVEGERVYLNRYFRYEQSVLQQIRQRVSAEGVAASKALATTLRKLFPAPEADIDWQAIAAATACVQPLCVITGGPGTGKTTTVTRLLSALLSENPDLRIALAAPTGKAAARMTESIRQARERGGLPHADGIPSISFTLHRLLGWSPRGFRYHSERYLPYDCIVVDEASMIDLPMMAHVLSALAPETRLILLGDRDQLASVEAGSVLADLCDAGTEHGITEAFAARLGALTGYDMSAVIEPECSIMQNAMVQLRKSHRFGEHSGIGALARAVNDGDMQQADAVLDDNAFPDAQRLPLDADDWQSHVIDGYQQYCSLVKEGGSPEWILEAFDQFQVLVALRSGPVGVEETNRRIERLLNRAGLLADTSQLWYPGRAIMITRNDYDVGLYNGDIGIMLRHEGLERVVFRDAEGGLRFLSPGRLPNHETAFAMTVHKSQGSEFSAVMLLLPEKWQQVITRELVYTAITRAKKQFWCRVGNACWQQALNSRTERASGLRDALWSNHDAL
ncbi:exodeoxyribonuclease V subunit alpha [Thalassolituus sp.]|jgi:exodeoxyribonuclease V alpha subunit|uniref:exodeoxyribonuclease V subunit alpha n=1 Tax=Thalassolituus sp. TaxID=2030822 RepID=UPI0027D63B1C|nr:exodeoxyribonuclease V subunit alpha [Thalassolituus sp.]MDQ4425229.1 exodeoxyribonuclease V subunit alpha [Thalassolituus sp.]